MAQKEWIDYYALLELYDPISRTGKGPSSTQKEIKVARDLQIRAWHPDKFRAGSEAWKKANERSKRINEAYGVLSNLDRKKAYDGEWFERNPWVGKEEEDAGIFAPEIAVRWDPPNAQKTSFYDMPSEEKRTAKLIVEPRVGQGFTVEILEPESGWLRVVKPHDRRGVPPFTAVVEVDTTGLREGEEYQDDLIFVVEGV